MRIKMFGKAIEWYPDYSADQFLEALENTFPDTISWDEGDGFVAVMLGDVIFMVNVTDYVIGFLNADEVVSESLFNSDISAY